MLANRKVFNLLGLLALALVLGLSIPVALAQAPTAPLVLQDFEGEVTLEDTYQATASIGTVAQNGVGSLASTSDKGDWHTVAAGLNNAPVDISAYDQICFGVNDTTAAGNTVGVKLLDSSGANTERWTDNSGVGSNPKTKANVWTTMCLNLMTYTGIDLTKIEKVQFTMFAAGVYYFDDVVAQMATGDQTVQANPAANYTFATIQDFENDGTFYSDYQADVSLGDVAYGGKTSLKATSDTGEWHAFGAYPNSRPLDVSSFDAVCFWIYDTTANNDGKADNTVGVSLIDTAGTKDEVWTDNPDGGVNTKTVKDQWVQMCINLSAYTKADLTKVDKIQFSVYWAGTYYVDDIALGWDATKVVDPAAHLTLTTAQDFEKDGTFYSDYQADVSLGDVAHGGSGSLKAASDTGEWHAFGAYPDPRPLDVSGYDKLCFWIYDTTANNDGKAANTAGVSLIDAAGTKDEVWTDNVAGGLNSKTVKDEWVQMCINLSAYTKADLTQIDKIQFALYWAGTYYVDDIAFGKIEAAAAATPEATPASLTFTSVQDFEKDGTFYSDYQADVSLGDVAHGGAGSLKAASDSGEWHAFGAYPEPRPLDVSGYDKLCFWIYDTSVDKDGKTSNTVSVSLIDTAGTKDEIWSDNAAGGTNPKTVKDQWVQMCINISAYTKADLKNVDKIQFSLYWAGTYYVDDIELGKAE